MAVVSNLSGASNFVLQEALSAYTDEAYTTAKKLSGTGIVGSNPMIDTSTETFVGQMRWFKPLNPTINVASLTVANNGTATSYTSDYLRYIKTVRTHGATKVNMQQVVTQQDGLAKIARDFGETRAQDEHDAILAVLRGVAISELLTGVAGSGGQTFVNDPASATTGFYVDAASKLVADSSASLQGAARAQVFLDALGKGFKDYEPEYAYLVTSPATMASLRSANLVDQNPVSEGNIMFNTIFGGKFRIIQTRATQGFTNAEITNINLAGTANDINYTNSPLTSFIVLPGALAMAPLMVPESVEIYRDARAYAGGGTTDVWYRWGYVMAPAGYDWNGVQTAFPSNAHYQSFLPAGVADQANQNTLGAGTVTTSSKGVWQRKAASALSLGILPIFHS